MKVITTKDKLKTIPQRWKSQYMDHNGNWRDSYRGKTRKQVYDELVNCKNLTVKKAEEIIGNYSWSTCYCDVCEKTKHSTFIFFECSGDDVYICKSCVKKAYSLINK